MKERSRDTVVALLVTMVCILLWQRLWGPGQTLYLWDAGTYFHPLKEMLGRTVQSPTPRSACSTHPACCSISCRPRWPSTGT